MSLDPRTIAIIADLASKALPHIIRLVQGGPKDEAIESFRSMIIEFDYNMAIEKLKNDGDEIIF